MSTYPVPNISLHNLSVDNDIPLLGDFCEHARPQGGSNSIAQILFPAGQTVRLAGPT